MFFHMVYESGQIFLPFCHNPRVWQTDRQTEFSSLDRICIPCSAEKNVKTLIFSLFLALTGEDLKQYSSYYCHIFLMCTLTLCYLYLISLTT